MANELQPLSLLFQNRLFLIPDYQRGYAWLQQQLVDFWDDLVNLQADRYHYTGLLSLKPLKCKETVSWGEDLWLVENGYKPCHIVDGQQRITTFVILLNEIVGFVRGLNENKGKSDKEITLGYETVEEIVSKYICRKRPPNGVVTTYLFGYEVDNPSAEYMKYKVFDEPYSGAVNETYYTKNLKFAKNFFAENIRKLYEESGEGGLEAVNTLYKKLTQRLMFNLHEIDDDYDVFVAFETMNNRGKKLTNLELLKNRLISIQNGMLTVENRNLFADTNNLSFVVRLEKNGVVLKSDTFSLNVPAGESKTKKLTLHKIDSVGEYVYHVSAVTADQTLWADAGHEIAFAQEVFEVKDNQIPETTLQKPTIVYSDVIIGVHGENFSMMFDKKEGGISSLKYNDYEYITRTPKVSFWRAMTDNDTGASEPYNLAQWYVAGKFAKYKTVSWLEQEDALKITFTYQAACIPTFEFTVTYTAHFDGKLGVSVNYAGVSGMSDMPILALDFKMKKQLCNFQYYGLGPDENYSDRCKGARLGLWKSTAKENLSGYLNPQECGNRTGVRTLSVHDDMQHGLTFQKASAPFEMNVLPYSAYELENAMHPDELPSVRYTWVRIAAKQMGVGGDDSWGAPVHEEYRIHADQPMKLEFVIMPLRS